MLISSPFNIHIGGVFLYSENAEALSAWYNRVFGLEVKPGAEGSFCHIIPYQEAKDSAPKPYIVWAIMPSNEALPAAQPKRMMINYRIADMQAFAAHLKALDIEYQEIETHPQGLFSWITDPDGNRLEIWQDMTPADFGA